MDASLKPVKDADVKKAVKTKAKVVFSPFKKDDEHNVDAEKLMNDTNRMTVNGSRLLWLKELECAAVTA
jgi:hypothetical protein